MTNPDDRPPFGFRDAFRVKAVAAWAIAAPVGAMVLVIAGGSSSAHSQLVVDASSLTTGFIDKPADLPTTPGVDGRLPAVQPQTAEVPETGTTDGQAKPPAGVTGNASGIPGTVLAAYQKAANDLAVTQPGCHLTWPLLAGIGKVESAHASGGKVDAAGNTRGKILGPVLNGAAGMAAIVDTDQGQYDGDTMWDRAVGPMQFIPGTWKQFGADGNGDGVKDPHNVFDAARASADYLCAGGANLGDPQSLVQAVLRYNHSMDYVSTVLRWMQSYSQQTVTVPDTQGVITPPTDDTAGNVDTSNDPTRPTTTTPPPLPPNLPSSPTTVPPGTKTPQAVVTPPVVVPPSVPSSIPLPPLKPPYTPPIKPRPPVTTPTPPPSSPTPPPDTPTPPPDTPTPPPDTPTDTPTPPPDTPTDTPTPPADSVTPETPAGTP
jgi:hypothetical protein